jgi:hypothetical protein
MRIKNRKIIFYRVLRFLDGLMGALLKERVRQKTTQLCMKLAAAKILIFDLTISNDRPSIETSKSKISALSDVPVKNAKAYKEHYS